MKRFFSIATILLFAFASEVNIMAQTSATTPIAPKAEGTMRIMTYNVGVIGKFLTDTFTKEEADFICNKAHGYLGSNSLKDIDGAIKYAIEELEKKKASK